MKMVSVDDVEKHYKEESTMGKGSVIKRRCIPKKERELVYQMFGGRCAYCGKEISYREMQVDHRQPLKRGGEDNLSNYLPACRICNHYKSTLPVEAFREQLELLTSRLQARVYIYKIALRYGLVIEQNEPIVFFFEKEEIKNV